MLVYEILRDQFKIWAPTFDPQNLVSLDFVWPKMIHGKILQFPRPYKKLFRKTPKKFRRFCTRCFGCLEIHLHLDKTYLEMLAFPLPGCKYWQVRRLSSYLMDPSSRNPMPKANPDGDFLHPEGEVSHPKPSPYSFDRWEIPAFHRIVRNCSKNSSSWARMFEFWVGLKKTT